MRFDRARIMHRLLSRSDESDALSARPASVLSEYVEEAD